MPCRDDFPQESANEAWQRRNDELAQMLCALCRLFEGTIGFEDEAPEDVKIWWAQHKLADEKRRAAERAVLDKQIKEAEALVKSLINQRNKL